MFSNQRSVCHFLVKFVILGALFPSCSLGAVTRRIFTYPSRIVSKSLTGDAVTNSSSEQRAFSTGTSRNTKNQNYSNIMPSLSSNYHQSLNASHPGIVPFEMEHLLSQAYSSDYYRQNNNRNSSFSDEYHNQYQIPRQSGGGSHQHSSAEPVTVYNNYNSPGYSDYSLDGHQYTYGQPHSQNSHKHEEENGSFEIEDKVFSKTVVATKALKVGKLIFTFFMVLVVLIIAALGKVGVTVSPVVLPLALLPLGVIALILFIPLFFLFVPLAATGVIGEGKKRRRRSVDTFKTLNPITETLQDQLPKILDKIGSLEWNY